MSSGEDHSPCQDHSFDECPLAGEDHLVAHVGESHSFDATYTFVNGMSGVEKAVGL